MKMTRISQVLPQSATFTQVRVAPETLARAAAVSATDNVVSTLQADHLRTRTSGHARQDEMWLGITWLVPDEVTPEQVADALTQVARRHDVMQAWFSTTPEGGFERCRVEADAVAFVIGEATVSQDVPREMAAGLREACSPFAPFGYTMFHVASDEGVRVVFAMDHTYGDAQSLLLLADGVHRLLVGEDALDVPHAPYSAYIAREGEIADDEKAAAAALDVWGGFVAKSLPDVDLGAFPGWVNEEKRPHELEPQTYVLCDEQRAQALEGHARTNGVNFTAVLYAACALAARDVAGDSSLRFVNPVHLRRADEVGSMGWYTGLVPMHVDVEASDGLLDVARRVRAEYATNRPSADFPFLRAYALMGEATGGDVSAWNGRFLFSYIDDRAFAFGMRTPPVDVALVSEAGEDVNISAWIFRGPERTEVLAVAPQLPDARRAVEALFTRALAHLDAVV